MAVVWSNSFDGPDGAAITVATSADHGDALSSVAGPAFYSDAWSATGAASASLGNSETATIEVQLPEPETGGWSLRAYLLIPAGGYTTCGIFAPLGLWSLDDEFDEYLLGSEDVSAHAGHLVGQPIRVEISVVSGTATFRVWWVDPYSDGTPDHEHAESAFGWETLDRLQVNGGGFGTPPVHVDELALAEGEWIGPVPDPSGPISATASLPLSGSAAITRHASLSATGTLALSREATVTREGRFTASASLPLSAPPVQIASHWRPSFPPLLTVEAQLGDAWVDITEDVLTREELVIRRGRADEAARADPVSMSLLLNNRHGRYSPRNPYSPHYGRIGRNTPVRARVGPMPEPGLVRMVDTFDRTAVDGWGTADTGQTWTEVPDLPTNRVYVSNGAGHMELYSINAFPGMRTVEPLPMDIDATWEFRLSTLPVGQLAAAIYPAVEFRRHTRDGVSRALRAAVGVRTPTGTPDGRAHLTGHVYALDQGSGYLVTSDDAIAPGVTYAPGEWVRVRLLAQGPSVRIKVWPSGEPEPRVWLTQGWVEDFDSPGAVEFQTYTDGVRTATPTPITVSFRDISFRDPTPKATTVRFTGEVSSWPSRWDLSDSDVTVPLQASGIGRRLGQGAKPLRSTLRRSLPHFRPLAYWPLEDGADTRLASEAMGSAVALRTTGLDYAEVDTLVSSDPLPKVGPGAHIQSGQIPAIATGSWEVDLFFRLEKPPETTTEQTLLDFYSTTLRTVVTIRAFPTDDRPVLTLYTYDLDGTVLAYNSIYIDQTAPRAFGQWARLLVMAETGSPICTTWASIVDLEETYRTTSHTYTYLAGVGAPSHVDTTFGAELGDLAIGHLAVWGARQDTAYRYAANGYAGQTTAARLARLAVGEDVPILVSGDAATRLGAEGRGTLLDLVGEAMDADLGAPGEPREELGLSYRARSSLYNQDPVLTLDYASGHISDPMEPQDDDQAVRNDVEVKRDRGASARVVDETGPLGVNTVGRYDESVTLSLATDTQAADQAGWRLHLGTVDELRWPTIRVNLGNPRVREHIDQILALDAGDRVRILNPPHWTQEKDLDLIVQGYEERINAFVWELELTCTPASPWAVARIANGSVVPPDAPMRADTAGSELAFAVDAEETHLAVATTTGPTWTTDPADLPFDLMVGGEIVRVTQVIGDGSTGFPQSLICERSINGITKPHAAGTPVRLAYPAVTAL